MIPIKEVMTRKVVSIKQETPIYECLRLLMKHHISGMPVVNDYQRVVGVLSEKDVLVLLLDDKLDVKSTAVDYMSREAVCFSPEDDAVEVCRFFAYNHLRRVPIVQDGKLCGIVSRRDIVKLILEAKSKMSDFRYV